MTIYIDSDYKCYTADAEGRRAVETDFFDGKCDEWIERFRFVPAGETWVCEDGDAELWISSSLVGHDLGEASITKTAGQTTSIDVSAIAKSSFITIWARSGNKYGNTIDISFDKVWLE